jgi:hypothetical protein
MDRPRKAFERFDQLVDRYPISPYAAQIKSDPEYQRWEKTAAARSREQQTSDAAAEEKANE